MQRKEDPFNTLVAENSDVSQRMYVRYIVRCLNAMRIKAEFIEIAGNLAGIHIPTNDKDISFNLYPIKNNVDGVAQEKTLMYWQEYPKSMRKTLESSNSPLGYYVYRANFHFYLHDQSDFDGVQQICSFAYESSDLQEFIYGAIYEFLKKSEIEIFPKMRLPRIAL